MFVDVIRYQLANGISEDFLRDSAKDILETWMKEQEGFLGWDIGKTEDGYTDLVFWRSKEDAEIATENMKDIPADHNWMKCYDFSTVKSEKIQNLMSFKNE